MENRNYDRVIEHYQARRESGAAAMGKQSGEFF